MVGGWVVGGGRVVPGKNLDHSHTILGNVRIMGSVQIVGELIKKQVCRSGIQHCFLVWKHFFRFILLSICLYPLVILHTCDATG